MGRTIRTSGSGWSTRNRVDPTETYHRGLAVPGSSQPPVDGRLLESKPSEERCRQTPNRTILFVYDAGLQPSSSARGRPPGKRCAHNRSMPVDAAGANTRPPHHGCLRNPTRRTTRIRLPATNPVLRRCGNRPSRNTKKADEVRKTTLSEIRACSVPARRNPLNEVEENEGTTLTSVISNGNRQGHRRIKPRAIRRRDASWSAGPDVLESMDRAPDDRRRPTRGSAG